MFINEGVLIQFGIGCETDLFTCLSTLVLNYMLRGYYRYAVSLNGIRLRSPFLLERLVD